MAETILGIVEGALAQYNGDVALCVAPHSQRHRETADVASQEKQMHPAMTQLSELSVAERIELVQNLWDSISASREQLPIQQWHRELVTARLADFDGREDELGISREVMWQQVDQRRGS